MESQPPTARNEFFRELKPRCVAINNLALRSSDKLASAKELISVTEDLCSVLEAQIRRDGTVLDDKLADYVFFPLSNVLRSQQQYPARLTEVTVKCLRILIQYGWKGKIAKELSHQLLILLTFIIGGLPGKERKNAIPEELKLEAIKALTALIKATTSSATGAASLVDADTVPALGHCVTVVLDSTSSGDTPEIQSEALEALGELFAGVRDQEALANFLPGTVSSISRLLTPPPAWKLSKRVLVKGIEVLKTVLTRELGDMRIIPTVKRIDAQKSDASESPKVLSGSWLRATADQIKLALSGILKLRTHDSEDIQRALSRLCISLLDECHQSLSSSAGMLVETAMILTPEEENKSMLGSSLVTSLADLAGIFPELSDTIKTTVYNWVTSMPRLMLSGDDETKRRAIRNLVKGQFYLSNLRIDSSTLQDSLAASLRDSVGALITSSGPTAQLTEVSSTSFETNQNLTVRDSNINFQPILMEGASQSLVRREMEQLIARGGSLLHHPDLAGSMLESLHGASENDLLATYWLAFELVKSGLAQKSELDDFLDLTSVSDSGGGYDQALQQLYLFSVELLNTSDEADDERDWRLQTLALEVTAFTASRMGEDFRPELIDVLYPMAAALGADAPQLRRHAVVALNMIAASSGYSGVVDLIIANVDYMVNSISLKLDTFDISPASMQVLRMMVKLAGPTLIPYLDDVVASIFAALDNYHGYPTFVESLFGVLTEVVRQGSQSDMLLIQSGSRPDLNHLKEAPRQVTADELQDILKRREERKRKTDQEDDMDIQGHPASSWQDNTAKELLDKEDHGNDGVDEVEEQKAPTTPTYALLGRITNLTQHYLTSPSPTLRKSLLDLLTIVGPSLAPDEESFLPIVNSIWPVLIARLYDTEPFVMVAACKALSALCISAGDFLATRIKTEWSDGLGKWFAKTKAAAVPPSSQGKSSRPPRPAEGAVSGIVTVVLPFRQGNPLSPSSEALETSSRESGLGNFAQVAQKWEAAKSLLVAITSYVRIGDDMFSAIVGLLADDLSKMPEARKALDVINADAVWLVMHERGQLESLAPPRNEEIQFVQI